jgi:hypothetical protein
MARELARKTVRLRQTGGSRSAVIPKEWLTARGIADQVDLVLTDEAILVVPPRQIDHSIEDEPEFARFLAFLSKQALTHPEILGDVGELTVGDEELFADVEPD